MKTNTDVKPEIKVDIQELEDFNEDGFSFVVTCGSTIYRGKTKNITSAKKRAKEIVAEIELSFLKERRRI
jgi:hypothetical protein